MMRNSTRYRSPRLQLLQLETRENPAGTVNASLANGVLTLTGDDDANIVRLSQIANTITVTGTNTTIVGGPVFNNVTSVKTVMKGGNDEVSIDNIGPFTLTGAANFDLGDGSNTLGLATLGVLSLGSLTVKAGDGNDAVTVSGTAGSEIVGNASMNFGAGNTDVDVTNLEINGTGGLKVNATDGADSVNFTNVQLARAATISTGLGQLEAVIIGGSTLGSLSLTGTGVNPGLPFDGVELVMQGSIVNGAIQVNSKTGARVDISAASAGSLAVTGGSLGAVDITTSGIVVLTTGGLTARGATSQLFVSPGTLDVATDIALLATRGNTLQVSGSQLIARGVRLTGSQGAAAEQSAFFVMGGGNAAIDLDVAITGRSANLLTTDSAVTARNLSLTGSANATLLQAGGIGVLSLTGALTLRAPQSGIDLLAGNISTGANLSISGSVLSNFSVGSGTNLNVGGTLSLNAGAGDVGFQLDDAGLQVGRDLTIAGKQSLPLNISPTVMSTVDRNVTFTLGNDDDNLTIDNNLIVQGNLTINAGAGFNSIALGTDAGNFAVGGNLAISSLGGADSVTLERPAVTGTTRVTTGAGSDVLQINGPATFTGSTTIDLGAGDDAWNVADDPATNTGTVTFTGTVNAKLGAGNDTLRLGRSIVAGGDMTTLVAFSASTANKIDGGAGLNLYDNEAALTTGTVQILNFTDPTPP